ncbi:hypothetical protein A3I25_00690 [Candidatus Nomurabacteria bacterium RIFCSPLOWO2_02_FULL_42_17]|uniref:Carotenoid biosynthesis protein n=1 Tax=Candidatus Nomurabacteria bacterium RIFCSPLOWO2_02_FULL_42_17 TaxID=1801789 RepID=A0A1F6XPU1_9BACT|nr:MAG: hypothetical protein A3I25_00690 [Candidatus Nomurabacteria bacterium RIFCSPLOWO2_02_FULL_42_17]
MRNELKILWGIFFLNLIIVFINLFGEYLGLRFSKGNLINFLVMAFPIILLIVHSFWTLSFSRGIFFILLASSIGFVAEFLGLNYGVIFGGQYVYLPSDLSVFNVPLSVIIFWAVFTYTGYCIVTSFLYWLGKDKPNIYNKKISLLPFIIIADGFVVLAIDLFMDPIQVKTGGWTWLDGGQYFNIPTGNFVGWLVVAMIIVSIFRLFEYFFPKKGSLTESHKSALMIPVIGYGLMAFSFAFSAIELRMNNLVIVGLLVMLPTVIINIILRKLYLYKHKE